MESLVIDTYSRRLQDMARSAARVARSAARRVSRFCVLASSGCGGFNIATRHDDLYK